jgi:putative tricarboxylic transport membrane protein
LNKANKIKKDIAITSGLTLFSIYIYLTASKFPKEAGTFPKIVSIFVIVLCIGQLILSATNLIRALKSVDNKSDSDKKPINKDFIITIITLIVYPILIFVIGFLLASFVYLVYTMYTYGYRNKLGITLISVITIVALYVIFVLTLRINLPVGLIGGF